MNERGFVAIAFAVLLPLLLTVVSVISGALMMMNNDAELRHHCRVSLLKSQMQNEQSLKALLALNTEAEALQTQLRASEAAAMAAPTPAAEAMAQAAIARTRLLQTALAVKQKKLIAELRLESTLAPHRAQGIMLQQTGKSIRAQSEHESASARTAGRAGNPVLIASPPDSIAPVYEPAPNFSESETIRASVTYPIVDLLPTWMKSWFDFNALKLTATCAATLEKEKGGNTWTAKLKADSSS